MSLLDSDDDDPFTDQLLKSHTGEPLFGDISKGRTKKADKKTRAEERRTASHWTKQKDNVVTVQEKMPKKVKVQSGAKGSVSKSPPDSPKNSRVVETKTSRGTESRGSKSAAVILPPPTQLQQPSPNVKSQRKRYSQLGGGSSSDEEGAGFLLSNKPALSQETNIPKSEAVTVNPLDQPSNPFLVNQPLLPFGPPPGPVQTFPPGGSGLQLSELQQQQAWFPSNSNFTDFGAPVTHTPSSPTLLLMGEQGVGKSGGMEERRLSSPTPQDFSVTNPFLTDTSRLTPAVSDVPPVNTAPLAVHTGPVFNAPPPPTTQPPPVQPHPPQFQGPPSPPTAPGGVAEGVVTEDWGISEELSCKCVQQFRDLEPVNGVLAGDKAREFFVQSKLPNQELSAIWRLSDKDQDNALSEQEFCIAMKLVLMRRKGFEIPATLPQALVTNRAASPSLLTATTTSSTHTSPAHPADTLLDMHTQQSAPSVLTSSSPVSEERVPSPGYDLLTESGGLLVDIGSEDKSVTTPPRDQSVTTHPRVGHIISIEDSPQGAGQGAGSAADPLGLGLEEEEDHEDSSVLVKVSSGSDSEEKRDFKPVRPAPPKPRPNRPPQQPRPYKKKVAPGRVGVSPVATEVGGETVNKGPAPVKPPRPSAFGPVLPGKKSSYSTLLTSPPGSAPSEELSSREKEGFQWRQLGEHPASSADSDSERGHSRSTSLDLNKMLLGHAAGDVFGGLPSAVPPKPPPKHRASSPPAEVLTGVDEEETTTSPTGQLRPRSLSTGSMASTGGGHGAGHEDIPHVLDTSTDALLLVQPKSLPPKAPKPKKVPILPPTKPGKTTSSSEGRTNSLPGGVVTALKNTAGTGGKRPPPPGKPNKLADLYQGATAGGMESEGVKGGKLLGLVEGSVGVVKDKIELQASIRSLKENNEALTDINKNLEEKLFKLMEERVRLARELNLLS